MRLMIYLLQEISQAISPETRVEVGLLVIDSFVRVRIDETTKSLIYVKIPYTNLEDVFPERMADPDDSNENESNEYSSSSSNQKRKEE